MLPTPYIYKCHERLNSAAIPLRSDSSAIMISE